MALGNKEVFKRNLRRYMEASGKSRKEMCDALGFSYTTFNDWYNGTKYPRIDKIEMISDYFGIKKSDLIEDKREQEQDVESFLVSNYINDAKIREFVLFAGGMPPGENRDKLIDSMISVLSATMKANLKDNTKQERG